MKLNDRSAPVQILPIHSAESFDLDLFPSVRPHDPGPSQRLLRHRAYMRQLCLDLLRYSLNGTTESLDRDRYQEQRLRVSTYEHEEARRQ